MRLSEVAIRLKRFDVAEKALKDVIRVAPKSASGYAALAGFYLQSGRNVAAAKLLARQAVDLAPTAENNHLLAFACQADGDRKPGREGPAEPIVPSTPPVDSARP
jgi:predicted Zn-dependent protease